MKNFTKQNFKTNPLWIRLLIMTFMLLAGAGTAWGACASAYISTWDGSKNTSLELSDGCNLLSYTAYSSNITYEVGSTFGIDFYVITDHNQDYNTGKVYYSLDGGSTQSLNLTRNGDYSGKRRYSCYLDIAATKATKLDVWITVPNYDDKWQLENNKQYTFKFTRQNSGGSDDCTIVEDSYIRIEKVSTYTPSIWAWDSDENFTEGKWPGVNMTAVQGESGVYYYKISRGINSESSTISVIFSNNGNNKSSDITGLKWGKVYRYGTDNKLISEGCLSKSCEDITNVSTNFSLSQTSYDYDGTAKKPTVSSTLSGIGTITPKYYNSSGTEVTNPTNAGTYTVKITVTEGKTYCALTTATTVGSYEIKKANQTALSISNGQTTFCGFPANDIELTVTGGTTSGAVTYSSDNESAATIVNNKLHVVAEGTVNVTATMAGNNNYESVTSAAKSFTFYKAPEAPTANQVSNLVKCGDNTENGSITINGYNSEYTYSIAPEATGDAQNGYSIATAGDYVITVTRRVNETCTLSTSSAAITVALTDNTPTIGDITITGAGSFCNGSTTTLTCSVDGDAYQWYKGETPISGETNKTLIINVTETASYKVEVIKTSPCRVAKMSDAVGVTKIDLPTAPALTTNSTNVCPGTVTLSNFKALAETNTVKWYSNADCRQEITVPTVEEGQTYTFYAKAINANGCVSEGYSTLTVKVYAKPDDFEMSAIPTEICSGADVVISISDKQDGVTYKLGETEINENITVNPTQTTTYTVVASLDVCPALTNSISTTEIVVNPIPSFVTVPSNLSLCKGATNETNLTDLSHVEVANGVAVWYDSETGDKVITKASLEKSGTYWVAAENSTTGCINPERKQFTLTINELPKYPELGKKSASLCQSNETEDLDKLAEINDVVWYIGENEVNNAHEISLTTVGTTTYTAKAVDTNGCQSATGAEFVLTIDAQPTFTAPAATQTNKEVTLTSAAGASTQWSVSPTENVTLTNNGDGTATFVATANGDYTITALNGVCAQVSHTIKVSDAFYIWVRNAKEGETAYANFYDPNQNTEDVRGGEMFYAECDALPTNGNNSLPTHFVNYNKGGRKADIITTDCDGYTWYGFKASAEVVAGTKYFYVHATNDKNYNGHFTHTVPTKKTLTSDVYYTLGTTNHATTYYGWNITSASAPYAGPKVYASGSTTLGTDKFAALYVTDCSGKEITGYQWYKDGQPYSSVCSYVGKKGAEDSNAGETNNIRPDAEGNYTCTVTYKDGNSATSAAVSVTGTYSRSFTSNIPVLVVNTGSKRFPDCTGLSGTASKNASIFKEKRSVDVKIYDGTSVIYDRKARMNYRGSSSLNFVKKSYAFCTGKEKTKNDKGAVDTGKENLFGLSNGAKDKDWVLYAAAADPSIMRNRLMLDTFRDMTGSWSVNSMYVELVINGEYKGVYVLMDKITANEKRVNVSWNLDKQGNTTQEGFIVKFDKTDIADRYENTSGDQKTFMSTYSGHDGFDTYDTYIDQRFEVEYPEKEDIEEEDLDNNKGAGDWSVVFNSIKDKFIKFEKELKDGNFSEVQKIIDYTSWADWFIITEFGKNIDGYRASNLFVYDGSKPNAKIEARPLWDQELSFDNQCPNYYAKYGANSENGLMVDKSNDEAYNNDASTPFWFTGRYKGGRGTYNGSDQTFKGLLDDPCFVAVVKARWEKHKANALSESKLNAKLEAYTTEMGAAKDREATFWSTRSRETCQCSFGGTTGYEDIDFDTSKGTISSWIKKRPAGLTKAIEDLKGLDLTISLTVTPEGGETTPWEAVMVKVNNPSGYDYDFKYTTNNLDQVEGVIIQESNDKYTYRIPRPSTWGTGDGTRAAIEYGIEATLLVGDEGSQCASDDNELTKATTTITLKDEENDNCTELTD